MQSSKRVHRIHSNRSSAIGDQNKWYSSITSTVSIQFFVKEFLTDGTRIEAAYRKYVHRANRKQTEDSYDLVICHANVIKYFVCRALQFPPEGWNRISLANSSITWLVIHPNGRVVLKALGDSGHLSNEKMSFS